MKPSAGGAGGGSVDRSGACKLDSKMTSHIKHRGLPAILIAGAVLLLMFCVGTSALSRQFVFGEGHAARPIVQVVVLYLLAWAGFSAACLCAWRRPAGFSPRLTAFILAVAVVARLVMSASLLVQENDCYRYVLDGESVLHGVNPFRFAPDEVAEHAPQPLRDALQGDAARLVLSRISYGEIPTIYPPLAQAAFAAGAWLTPWRWHGQRVVFIFADLVTIVGLLLLLRCLGRPPAWVVFYAWNPLVLKEVVNSAHVDALMGPCLIAVLLGMILFRRNSGHVGTAGLLLLAAGLSAAILVKLYPLLLAPVAAAYVLRQSRRMLPVILLAALTFTAIAAAYAPFLGVGFERLTEGLRAFGGTWERNAGLYLLVDWLLPSARAVSAAVPGVVALLAGCYVLRARDPFEAALAGMQWTLLAWLLFLPMVFPWYALGLLVLTTCRPRVWGVVLSGMLGLYYLLFFLEYGDYPECFSTLLKWVEHGVVITAVSIEFLMRRFRRGRASPASAELPRKNRPV